MEEQRQQIYDDDSSGKPVTRPELPSANDAEKAEPKNNTNDQSQESSSHNDGDSPGSWRTNVKKQSSGLVGRFKKMSTSKKLLLGGGGSAALIFLLMIITFLGTLSIPNLAQNIATYQFARTARTFAQASSEVTAEKVAVDAARNEAEKEAGQTVFDQISRRYSSVRSATWGQLDNFRPQKVLDNMKANGDLEFSLGPKEGLLGRQPIEGVNLLGEEISLPKQKFGDFLNNSSERMQFASQIDTVLAENLEGVGPIVRGNVAKKIREELGIKLFWWEKLGKNFVGKNPEEAAALEAQDSFERTAKNSPKADSEVADIQDAQNKADDALQKELETPEGAAGVAKTGENLPPASKAAIEDTIANGAKETINSVTSKLSALYGIAMPLCMIYDGSIVKAGPMIDKQSTQLQREYYAVASAADQQKAGATTSQAIGAMDKKLSGVATSIPLKRASGETVTTSDLKPQASVGGDYTLINTLFGTGIAASTIDDITSKGCPAITDWRTGTILALAETGVKFIPGGGQAEGAAEGAAEEAAATALQKYMQNVVDTFTSRAFYTKLALQTAGITAATMYAKMSVISHMGAQTNGLSQGASYAEQADAGGNLHAQELNRQQLYGRPMNNTEVALSNQQDQQYLAMMQSHKNAYERYLAMDNPLSLRSKLSTQVATTIGTNNIAGTLARGLSSINLGNLAHFLGNILSLNRVSAADTQGDPYGIIQWGWTQDEDNLIQSDPTYSVLENSKQLSDSGQSDAIEKTYGDCFTKSMGTLISEQKIVRNQAGDVLNEGLCSPKNLGPSNNKFGKSMVFRWRLDKRNQNTLDQLTQIQDAQ